MNTLDYFFKKWPEINILGVKVIANNNIEDFCNDRVNLSNGLEKCDERLLSNYVNGAFLPKLPWRQPTESEIDYIYAQQSSDFKPQSYIGIVKFIPEFCDNILLAYGKVLDDNSYLDEYNKVALEFLTSEDFLSKVSYDGDIILAGLSNQFSGLITVSEDRKLKKFVGLHLDSWEKVPLIHRNSSSNRICINLSTERRYLLFINLTLWEMKTILGLPDGESPSSVCTIFMNTYQDYPVIRIAVNPYEAYIAPTENIIHDGSTLGMITNSLCYTYRGQFKLI